GKGFKTAMSSLDVGRLLIAAQALGIAQGAFDQTVEYMKQRKQFGRSLDRFQALAFEMANMMTRIDGSRFLLYNACNTRDRAAAGDKSAEGQLSVTAAQAKLSCSETASLINAADLRISNHSPGRICTGGNSPERRLSG
ncbi:acyl-CoA dehydrogenase family protein, partial [Eubacteriales bacterium DFI.9.88]|nr:acyl-CoA dehydrogenase family protein [Eubacteriales bacterium DFI.9.88]